MKSGKTLVELAQTLQDIKENAKDFMVPTARLAMTENAKISFVNGEAREFSPTDHAHGQIAQYAGVPKAYYDKLRTENPTLLSKNVNHGFEKESSTLGRGGKPETRLVRSYRGDVRAILSSSYRRLDSYDMAKEVLPIFADRGFEVVSSEITDQRMYLKVLTPKLQMEIKPGDVVQYGLVASNSDVGAGSCRIEPLIYRLICTNGMISNTAIRKFHVGKNMAADGIIELLSDETQRLTDAAFWAQVRDIVLASMRPEIFESEVNRLRDAASQKITNFDIPEVVDLSMKTTGTTGEKTRENIIAYLANGADGAGLTKWGLINAYTAAAQAEHLNYDQSVNLERDASRILELSPNQWNRIATAA